LHPEINGTPGTAAHALLHCKFATHSEGADACTVRGGALELPAWQHTPENHSRYLFHMDGPRIHELASRHLPGFLRGFLDEAKVGIDELDLVIPHQAGLLSMRIMQRKLRIPESRFVITIAGHGNVISASIPLAMHLSRQAGRLRPGHRALLVGTAAGLTLGAALLQL
jgi:3-oxoacyl-[acyl-carrier-protein] synthase-3